MRDPAKVKQQRLESYHRKKSENLQVRDDRKCQAINAMLISWNVKSPGKGPRL